MSSSSGGTNRAGPNQTSSKIKSSNKFPVSNPGFLQQIIINPPSLNITNTEFSYDISSLQTVDTSWEMVLDKCDNAKNHSIEYFTDIMSPPENISVKSSS